MAAKDADEEPPADGFGREGVTWRPSAEHDPVRVAALHLQHQLITAARRAWPHVHAGSELTGRALAELLGTPTSIRPAEKRLAGRQLLQLEDIVRLALCLGDGILAALPSHVTDVFPEPYHPLLGAWQSGRGTLPTFRGDRPGGHNWVSAVASLIQHLDEEVTAERDHLLTAGAITYALVQALNDSGTHPSTIELDDRHRQDDATCTLAMGPATNTTLASVAFLPDREGPPRVLAERLGGILYDVAGHDADHRVLVLVAGPAATRQLRTQVPRALDSPVNSQFVHRFQTLIRTPPPGEVPSDLEITVLARGQQHSSGTVVALLVTKLR